MACTRKRRLRCADCGELLDPDRDYIAHCAVNNSDYCISCDETTQCPCCGESVNYTYTRECSGCGVTYCEDCAEEELVETDDGYVCEECADDTIDKQE